MPKDKDAKELEIYGLKFVKELGYINGKTMRTGTISLIEVSVKDSFDTFSPSMFLTLKITDY